MNKTYHIVRFYHPSQGKPVERIGDGGLSLEEARAHCNDPTTRKDGEYFDGYRED